MTKLSIQHFPSIESLVTISFVIALSGLVWSVGTGDARARSGTATSGSAGRAAGVRVPFIENRGQLATDVRYYAQTSRAIVYVTGEGDLVYALKPRKKDETAAWALKETIKGAVSLRPQGQGNARRRSSWMSASYVEAPSGVPMPEVVRLGEVYPGIELDLKAYRSAVKKSFIVRPGASPKTIEVEVSGAQSLKITTRGALEIGTDIGSVRLKAPVAYQLRDGKREYVRAAYRIGEAGYGYRVDLYDSSRTLFID